MHVWQNMNRTLRVLTMTGVASSLLLGGGLYAVLNDVAFIGLNSVQTGELPVAEPQLDLQIAEPVNNSCQDPGVQWMDDQIPGVFDSDQLPVVEGGSSITSDAWCVRRVDNETNTMVVSLQVGNLVDYDLGCSAEEAEAGDVDCATPDPGSGEVSDTVFWNTRVDFNSDSCDHVSSSPAGSNRALQNGQSSSTINLQPNFHSPVCMWFGLFVGPSTTLPQLQRLQTDYAEWDWSVTGSV